MNSHADSKFQYVARCYRVVSVSRDGDREIISRHDAFLRAERARKMIPSQEGVEIRIETAIETEAVSLAG